MRYDELEQQLGTTNQAAIASVFGVKQPAVSMWKKRGEIPPRRVAEYRLRLFTNPPSSANVTPPSPSERAEDHSPA